ncbi:MAG: NAD(P)(+) transhydrogenase (Re/Si-specific) subunit beta, partial [Boseongicola sp.]|nr:NAD(P)(+) transhydrogenase (Re/Si-specific) subunit beta [Boseongicola sp.]
MSNGLVSAAYIAASVLFILSLGGLSNQESAKRAIWYGIVGMAIAILATVLSPGIQNLGLIVVAVAVGAFVGQYVAARVKMTEMPQLVAALHSFVGLAAVFIGLNADIMLNAVTEMREAGMALEGAGLTAFGEKLWKKDATEVAILKVEVFLGIVIGAITFTGSVVAIGKLAGKLSGKPKKHML